MSPFVELVTAMRKHVRSAGNTPKSELIFRLRPDVYETWVLGSIEALSAMGQWEESASIGGFEDIPVVEDGSVLGRWVLHRCGLKGGVE